MAVEFFVPGVPVPQGSKTAFVVGKRAIVTDANEKVLKPWRTAVAEVAQQFVTEESPLEGALWVEVQFQFVRPKSVKRPYPAVAPDIDKLVRSVLDGITGSGLYRDDAQVVRLFASKEYSDRPGAFVRVGQVAAIEGVGQ